MAQPANDAYYSPATTNRNHGEAGAYNPYGEKVNAGGAPLDFTMYLEPVDAANLRAYLKDAVAKRQGINVNFDAPVTFYGRLDGDTVGFVVVI